MSKIINPRSLNMRSEDGMSLAAVLAMSVVITLFVTALLSTLMPVLQKTAQFKHQTTVRSFAEMSMDYAINQMNTKASNSDCQSTDNGLVSYTIPGSVLGDTKASATVTVATLPAYENWLVSQSKLPSGKEISAADLGVPPSTSILRDPSLAGQFPNSYRMLSVTANYGRASSTIRSLLMPVISSSTTPSFPFGVFGMASIVYAGKAGYATYNSADPRIGAEGGSLGKISQVYGGGGLGRSIIQGGSHYEFPDPQSYYAKQFGIVGNVYNAVTASTAPWNTMTGNVYSNGKNTAYYSAGYGDYDPTNPVQPAATQNKGVAYDDYTARNSKAAPAHNVLGIKNGIYPNGTIPNGVQNGTVPNNSGKWSGANPTYGTSSGASWNPGPLNANGVTFPQPAIPTTPSAPIGTPSLGSINVNGGTLIFDHTAAPPSGAISSVTSGKTLRIPPGDYTINTMSVTNGGSIKIASNTQAAIAAGDAPPVSLYVSGTNNGAVVINVDNKSSINMDGISNPTTANGFNTTGNIGTEYKNKNGSSVLADNQISISPPGDSTNVVETSGSAAQLQMYYNGSSFNKNTSTYNTQVVLQGNQRMTMYAPNTGILIGSSAVDPSNGPTVISNDTNFYGAIVGGSVGINSNYGSGGGVYMHYDQTLAVPGKGLGKATDRAEIIARGDANPLPPENPWAPRSPIVYQATHTAYRAISWQETDANGRFPGQQ